MEIEGLRDLHKIGEGGFARVYRAFEPGLDTFVAAKVLKERLSNEEVRRRFVAEVKGMGRVGKHPAVVTVHRTAVTTDRFPVIVMEYVSGGTLTSPQRSQQVILSAGVRVSSALDWIHGHGLLHNDVKPSNVFIDQFGEPKLGDFGISAITSADGTSELLGVSFEFAAPEVLDGAPGPMSDVYALAGTLYRALTGDFPLQRPGEDPESIGEREWVRRIDDKRTRPISLVERGFSAPLNDLIVDAGLARSPGDRPTAAEFGERLRQVEAELGFPMTAWPKSVAPAHKVRTAGLPTDRVAVSDVEEDAHTRTPEPKSGQRTQALDRRVGPIEPVGPPETTTTGPWGGIRGLDPKVLGFAGATAAIVVLLALFLLGRSTPEGPEIDPQVSLPSAVPTLEAPAQVVAPENLKIARQGDGTALVSWSDRNVTAPTFEVQFVDAGGALGEVTQTEDSSLVLPAIADVDSTCVVVRAIGERGRISRDVGPVCLEATLGESPVVAVVPRGCAPGACDFRLDASNYSADDRVSITVIGPDGVDLNAEFGGAYEPAADVRSDGSIEWFFDPGSAAPIGTYTVEVVDVRTAQSSVAVFELVSP